MVILFRDPDKAENLRRLLAESGVEAAVVAPTGFKVIEPDAGFVLPAETRWIAFTSRTGVAQFAELLANRRISLPAEVKLAALAGATRTEVIEKLGRCDLAAGKSGAELALSLARECRPGELILWPCAAKTADGFAEGIESAELRLARLPLYATVPRDPAELRAEIERVTSGAGSTEMVTAFFAPSGVEASVTAYHKLSESTAIAIGDTTAHVLTSAGFDRVIVSDTPDDAGMLAAIRKACS